MQDHDDDGSDLEGGSSGPVVGEHYWERRRHMLYYEVVRIIAQELGKGADSVIDVGSWNAPTLDWFPAATHKTSLDLRMPFQGEGVQSVTADFLTWPADRTYDLALCLQVLEHVPDAGGFARRLLEIANVVLISVPFRWPSTKNPHHIHDPVTVAKINTWFGRKPNFTYLVREPISGVERVVCVFDRNDREWSSLHERAGKRGFRPAKGTRPLVKEIPALTIRQSLRALYRAVRRRTRSTIARITGRKPGPRKRSAASRGKGRPRQ
jgi:hypothetical protein